jgi:hypothetical protein
MPAGRTRSARLMVVLGSTIPAWCGGAVTLAAAAKSSALLRLVQLVPLVPASAVALIVVGLLSPSR